MQSSNYEHIAIVRYMTLKIKYRRYKIKQPMHENLETIVPEKEKEKEALSRRGFLKMVGLAAGAVIADKLIPKTLAESKESGGAIEVSGLELPKPVQEAIRQNNYK